MPLAVHRVLGPGSPWFQPTGWTLLDRVNNACVRLDFLFNLVALAALSMHGHVFWAGVAERRRRARLRLRR